MALGKSNIENARNCLAAIAVKLESIQNNNKAFLNLFNDDNFQKFVRETNKGKELGNQLTALKEWIDAMSMTVDDLKKRTDNYLNIQESINN